MHAACQLDGHTQGALLGRHVRSDAKIDLSAQSMFDTATSGYCSFDCLLHARSSGMLYSQSEAMAASCSHVAVLLVVPAIRLPICPSDVRGKQACMACMCCWCTSRLITSLTESMLVRGSATVYRGWENVQSAHAIRGHGVAYKYVPGCGSLLLGDLHGGRRH